MTVCRGPGQHQLRARFSHANRRHSKETRGSIRRFLGRSFDRSLCFIGLGWVLVQFLVIVFGAFCIPLYLIGLIPWCMFHGLSGEDQREVLTRRDPGYICRKSGGSSACGDPQATVPIASEALPRGGFPWPRDPRRSRRTTRRLQCLCKRPQRIDEGANIGARRTPPAPPWPRVRPSGDHREGDREPRYAGQSGSRSGAGESTEHVPASPARVPPLPRPAVIMSECHPTRCQE